MNQRTGSPLAREGGRPLVLVPRGADAGQAGAAAQARLEAAGWRVVPGLATRPAGDRVVLVGTVDGDEEAAAAVLAALDGYGLLLLVTIEGGSLHRLEDDLRRLGTVEVATGQPAAASPSPDATGLAILAMLARGHTLGEAANTMGLSRRTADRRLAAAKRALGASRTTEAIAVAAKLGMLEGRRPG